MVMENHWQAYAPTGAMVLKWWGSLTSKLDGYPVTSEPHLWWQACPWRKSLSRKIALTRIKFYGRKLQVKAFQTAFGQMQGCADFMRLWRNFMPRQFSITIYLLAKSGLYEMRQHIQSTENIHWAQMSATWSTNADNIAGNWAQHYPILSGLSILFCLLLRHDALRF